MNSYRNFSYYYDEIMDEIEYNLWYEFVKPYLKANDTILDLACGTGTLPIILAQDGYQVSGLDLSSEAIYVAQEKTKMNHLDINYHIKDMSNFNLNEKFNVITCFFDSINFLNHDEVKRLLDMVNNHLNPNGYFIFDIFTKSKMKSFNHTKLKRKLAFSKYKWKMKVKNDILYHDIKIIDNKEIINEKYLEYYYDYQELLDNRFELVKLCTDFKDEVDFKNGERLLVVLKKKAQIVCDSHHEILETKNKDLAIDATCGNGHDTLFLADNFTEVIAIDIQELAIKRTKNLLKNHNNVKIIQDDFNNLQNYPKPSLIIFNLGFLPGSNKQIKTQNYESEKAILKAINHVKEKVIIACYLKHDGGILEYNKIIELLNLKNINYTVKDNYPNEEKLIIIKK